MDDMVKISYFGTIDGVPFDGGKSDEYNLVLGSNSFIDTFEEQLVGKKAGDEVLVKVKFPDNYHQKALAGKDAEFQTKILEVSIKEDAELTDDFVKNLDRSSGFTRSTSSAGTQIHNGYKVGDSFVPEWKEYRDIPGIRPDYVDFDNKIIYELKPNNPRSIQKGIRQLQQYNEALGGGYTMRLELY